MSETLHHLLAEAKKESDDPDVVTDLVLKRLEDEELRRLARPAVRNYAYQAMRDRTRTAERSVALKLSSTPASRTTISALRDLLGRTFVLPSGERVSWDDATVEQHQERAAYLRKMADGAIRTADMHERAALVIANAGVNCLREVDSATAAIAA